MHRALLFAAICCAACGSSSTDTLPTAEAGDDTAVAAETSADVLDDASDGADPDVALDAPPADTGPDPTDRSKCTVDPDKAGITKRTAAKGSMTYIGFAPTSYDAKTPLSLVIALHGAGDTNSNYINLWQGHATTKKFLLVVPEGTSSVGPGFTWNSGDKSKILGVIDDFATCYSVDPKRRIIHGFSAGGIMAYYIGLDSAPLFAGISIASANLGSAEAIAGKKLLPAKWLIPVSHFHGISDTNFPIATARAGRDQLLAAGHKVYWHEFPGGHTTNAVDDGTMYDDLASSTAP